MAYKISYACARTWVLDGWTQAREDWAYIVDWGERKPRTDWAGVVNPAIKRWTTGREQAGGNGTVN